MAILTVACWGAEFRIILISLCTFLLWFILQAKLYHTYFLSELLLKLGKLLLIDYL